MHDEYGRRLMPSILHYEAKHNPQRTFAITAKSDGIEDGFFHVTFQQIAQAVNHLSYWLQNRFEKGDKPPRHVTLAYIGVPDLRYNILFYAAIQCRYKVFLPSPRNPTAVNVSLLEQTDCTRLVHSIEVSPVAKALLAVLPGLQCEQLPSLEELLAAPALEYAYDLKFEDVYHEPILILHSSGSTGQPKPVVNTHGTFATYDFRDWPVVPGRVNHDGLGTLRFPQSNSCIYDVFPPFHIAGFMTKVMVPIYNLTAPIFGPPLRPPSGALAAEIIRMHKPRGAVIPPSITEQLYHEKGGIDIIKQLDVLLFAGGPLPQIVGDEISKHTTLCQFYGSTEMSQIRQLIPLPEDWSYIQFHPNERFELQPAGEGMFELVVFADKSLEQTSSLYHNYPDVREWRTKDLFKPHPNKPDLWKFHARRDDILVFSSGEKLNPIPMESSLTAISRISGALVVGQGQRQAALLIELNQNAVFSSDPREELWQTIETANALLPGHGRVARSMIIIASPDKPFARAGKGTVVRRLTEDLYASEIQMLYEAVLGKPQQTRISLRPSLFRADDIYGLIRSILEQVSVNDRLNDEENFYTQGMDSVKTAEAVAHLKASLLPHKSEADLAWISSEVFYRNPSIIQLSPIILEFLNNGIIPKNRDRIAEMKSKISEYTRDLPTNLIPRKVKTEAGKLSVAITGTTGYLGRHLLSELAKNPRISRIYCLNRSATAQSSFEEHRSSNTADLVFLHANFVLPNLGLSSENYTRLLQDCDIIVHNAWRVDFNANMNGFEDNFQSIKNLITLSATSALRPRIVFISSISSTGIWGPAGSERKTIPEHISEDLSVTMNIGYAESKQVAEHVLYAAASQGVPATIIRMGQISPGYTSAEDGKWPENDMIPVFLRTCKACGLLPTDFIDTIDWVPIDQAAATVAEIVEHETEGGSESGVRFYNVVHPKAQPWSSVMDVLQIWCGDVQKVSMEYWVENLRGSDMSDSKTIERLPALRMLEVFDLLSRRGPMHEYAMENLVALDGSIVKLPAVDATLMQMWLQRL